MTDNTTTDKLVIQYESVGAKEFADAANNAAKSIDGVVVSAEKVEKSTGSIDGKFAALERRFGTAAGQASQFEKVQKTVNDALAAGGISQQRANEVIDAARSKYGVASNATRELAEAQKGLSGQAQSLQHAMRSAVDSIAAGAPITQVVGQQFGHLTYAMSGQGGISGALGELKDRFGGLVSPMTATVGVIGLVGAAAAAAAIKLDQLQVSSQKALIGPGAQTGTTISDLNDFTAKNSASYSGSSLSAKEARALGEDLTKTGEVVISRLHGMSDAVVGFANQTDISMSDARKAMVGFAADPKKALEGLTPAFGSFDMATRRAVEALVLADDKTGAFNVILDALAEKAKRAAENMGLVEKAGRGVTNVLASETTKPRGIEGELADAQGKLSGARSDLMAGLQQAAPAPVIDALAERVAKLSQTVDQLQAAVGKVDAQHASAELNKLSTDAENVTRSVLPQIDAINQLNAAINKVQAAQAQGVAPAYAQEALTVDRARVAALQDSYNITVRQAQAAADLQEKWGGVSLAIAKQLESLKDQNTLIKAQQNGTEGAAKAAIAYKDAMLAGAKPTEAAAVKSAVLANNMAQAAQATSSLSQYMDNAYQSMQRFIQGQGQSLGYMQAIADQGVIISNSPTAEQLNNQKVQGQLTGRQMGFTVGGTTVRYPGHVTLDNRATGLGIAQLLTQQAEQESRGISGIAASAYATGGIEAALAAIKKAPNSFGVSAEGALAYGNRVDSKSILGPERSNISDKISTYDQLVQLQNSQTSDKATQAANLQGEISFLQTLPASPATAQKIVDLQKAIEDLTKSTDDLNNTNGELLSPYYTQDPRTSHIGFRSQGMASTGYIDIPGTPSANDNMTLTLPVASGERVWVGNGPNRGTGGTNINMGGISIVVNGSADTNAIGRTVYQLQQDQARALRRAGS